MAQRKPDILCIFAHPDDAEIWMGGTLASGCFGRRCVLIEFSSEARQKEAEQSAAVLGYSVKFGRLSAREIDGYILKDLPDIVFTHHFDDVHPEHRKVYLAVERAIILNKIKHGKPKRLFAVDTYGSTLRSGTIDPTVINPIDDFVKMKEEAIRCHVSQPVDHFCDLAKRQTGFWGLRVGSDHAEPFVELPILGRKYMSSLFW